MGAFVRVARASLLAGSLVAAGAAAAQQAAARPDGEVVVARRGTADVTLGELDARMEEVPADQRVGFMSSPERIDTTLQQLLLNEQLANEAIAAGLDRDPRLAAQLDLARKRFLTGLLIEQMRGKATEGVDVTALARERYASDRSAHVDAETRTVRHLLVSTANRTDADAKARIDALQARLATGESLADLAQEASDDAGSRASGGLIADIPAGRTDPEFERAMLTLRTPGEVTPTAVRSQFGYHLIELVSVKPARQRSFDEVRAQIEAEVLAAAVERRLRAHRDDLNSLPIEADAEVLATLRNRYGAPESLPTNAPALQPSQAKSAAGQR